ncbi:MAG: hypothetical protein PHD76_14095 [Methylacidiphilales bacterium]|nr:hypothetical protein [Candidatus Methylacidiphilales bacterium]
MKFSEVPSLAKFEKHALANSGCPITQYAYKAVSEIIGPVETMGNSGYNLHETAALLNLKTRCEAIEKSTRIIWACAAATDHVKPRKWDYVPDFQSALDYFKQLGDLELMAETKDHRITWEQKIHL